MNESERKRWVVAVDGGGSKISIAAQLCTDDAPPPDSLEAARLWAFAHCGSAHPSIWHATQQHLSEALNVVGHALTLPEAGCPIRHVVFALAGAGREADRAKVLGWARALPAPFDCSPTTCVSDIEPLIDYRHIKFMRSGSSSDEAHATSVAVILGTGSMVATRDRKGQIIRAGGWGPHLGDECSGGALGIAALRSVTEWLDAGSAANKATPLVSAVLSVLPNRQEWLPGSGEAEPVDGAGSAADFRPDYLRLDRDRLGGLLIEMAANRSSSAGLAHVVLELAFENQDAAALRLMDVHLERLSWEIEQVVRRAELDPSEFELVLSGGLASNYRVLREALIDACRARGLSPREAVVAEPLLAALRLAFAEARHG